MLSSVSRVCASTRAATLTAPPMTEKLSRPAPPIAPATTRPVLTPTPIRSSPASPRSLTAAPISQAARTARSAWSGNGSGAPNTASSPSPSNLSTWPPWPAMIGTITSNSRLSAATTSCRRRAGGERGEVADVAEQHRDLDLDPLLGEALGEDVLGDLLVEVGAERLADALALGEPRDHLVEAGGELAELVAGGHRDRDVVVALADPVDRAREVGERAQDRLREQHRELERDRGRDQQRDQHVEAEVGAAAAVGGERGDHEAGDQVDQRQRDHQPRAQRDRPEVGAAGAARGSS